GDVVAFYFAGHAAVPAGGEAVPVLLPVDARSADPAGSGWRPDEAIDELSGKGGTTVVLWLDTAPEGRGRGLPRPGPAAAEPWLRGWAGGAGVSAWLAAEGRPAAEAPRVGASGPFAAALVDGLGTREAPRGLLACLGRLRRDKALAAQGFRSLGGVDPDVSL